MIDRAGRRRSVRGLAALLVAPLLLAGCTDDGPPDALATAVADDEAAAEVVRTGEVDGEPVDGVPADRASRLGLLLTGTEWEGADAAVLSRGLLAAAEQDPDLLTDVVAGVGGADAGIHPGLRSSVTRLLLDDFDAVAAAYGAPTGPTDLDRADLDAVLSSVAVPDGGEWDEGTYSEVEQAAFDTVLQGMGPALDEVPDARWEQAVAAAEDQWTRPVGSLLGATLRPLCETSPADCADQVGWTSDFLERVLRGAAYDSIPVSMLPDSLLLASGERRGDVGASDRAWTRIADRYPALDITPSLQEAAQV